MNIRLPNINAQTESGQIAQMRGYLYQFAEELQWALNAIESGNRDAVIVQDAKGNAVSKESAAQSTFSDIKGLIMKSADIVNAYYEKMGAKLNGDYVARSEYGEYTAKTSATLEATSDRVEQTYTNVQEIKKGGWTTDDGEYVELGIDEIGKQVVSANAYIKTGLLRYETDGSPVYGVSVGQHTEVDGEEVFDAFAEFTANRLAFFDKDPNNPVAYISDYKLHILHAEVDILKVGGFRFDTTNGLAIYWEG